MNRPTDRTDTNLRLETLVARVLESLADRGSEAIEEACRERPELSDALRERIALLQELGLADHPKIEQIGPYRVLRSLGEGGMGQVFLAEQTEPVHRLVAIKWIRDGVETEEVLARFDLERQVLAVLEHPGVARAYEAGQDEHGRPYFVMEWVDGPPITRWADDRCLTLRQRIELFLQVTDAVQHAHARGLIHRDLKPGNILVRELDGQPVAKVIDFGLAKSLDRSLMHHSLRTEVGQLLGTPETMSPEQAEGGLDSIDVRTDVYSLGVVVYELMTGTLPIPSETLRSLPLVEMLQVLRSEPIEAPSRRVRAMDPERAAEIGKARSCTPESHGDALKGDLDWILERALAKDLRDRYATVRDFEQDLRRHLEHRPVSAAPERFGYRTSRFVRRHRRAVAAAAILAVLAVAGTLAFVDQYFQATENLQRFDRLADLDEATQLESELDQELWPLVPESRPGLRDWRRRWNALESRSRGLRSDIDELRRSMSKLPARDIERRRSQSLLNALLSLEPSIQRLRGLADELGRRLKHIDWVERRSLIDAADAWSACLERISSSDHYPLLAAIRSGEAPGMEFGPQFGLVPLGPDPISGLEEFALLTAPAAVIPERNETGSLGQPQADWEPVLTLVPTTRTRLGAQNRKPNSGAFDPEAKRNEYPPWFVQLPAFFIGKHEISQGQWTRAMGDNPSLYSAREAPDSTWGEFDDTHPVETVSWYDARRFARRAGCELPTEARWELAARGGTSTPYWWGDGDPSTFVNAADATLTDRDQSEEAVSHEGRDGFAAHAPIGTFPANPFGLHEISGNVWEWCLDGNLPVATRPGLPRTTQLYRQRKPPYRADGLRVAPEEDPVMRSARGGGYRSELPRLRSAFRFMAAPGATRSMFGVRVCRSIDW